MSHEYAGSTRNVQRAGPKARKGSARAPLSLSLLLSFFSLLLSSLLLIDRNVQRAGAKAALPLLSLFLFIILSCDLFSFADGSKTLRAPDKTERLRRANCPCWRICLNSSLAGI